MALGLRFAGTHHPQAAAAVKEQLLYFLSCKKLVPDPRSQEARASQVDRPALESAAGTAAMALAAIMAGSCHLPTLQLLRGLARRLAPTNATAATVVTASPGLQYGHHMAISTAVGFLCLGRGTRTFSRSNQAVAALLMAMYPLLPATSVDNRSHLQALRHLYVLATVPLKQSTSVPGRPGRETAHRDAPSHEACVAPGQVVEEEKATSEEESPKAVASHSRAAPTPGRPPLVMAVQQRLDEAGKATTDSVKHPRRGWHQQAEALWWRCTAAICANAGNSALLTPLLTLRHMATAVESAIAAGDAVDVSHSLPAGMPLTAAVQQLAIAREACCHLTMLHGPPGSAGATSAEREVLRAVTVSVEGVCQRLTVLWQRMGFSNVKREVALGAAHGSAPPAAFKPEGIFSDAKAIFYRGFLEAREVGLAF